MEIKIKLIEGLDAKIPTQNHIGDAGYDLYSVDNIIIPSRQRCTIKTGICIAIPYGYVGLIWPRSGLSVKRGVDILAGVIDSTYRGEIMVCLLNTSGEDIGIASGDKIAQLLIQKIEYCNFKQCDNLDETDRNDKGFGSSG
jgi:dUTP pyrophosphatase